MVKENGWTNLMNNNLSLTLQEVSDLLALSRRATKRIAKYLDFPIKRPNKNTIIYNFPPTHPFYQSYLLLKGPAKPIYIAGDCRSLPMETSLLN
jgi:hypothetical protein